jgi:dephospho-CoA kinase
MTAGLTGGIGSGKTTVARLFAQLGAAVFYSDQAAKDAYFFPHIKERVIALMGNDAYQHNQLNRPYISARVFGDAALLAALNNIIHPEVGVLFRSFAEINRQRLVIKESALLFEAGITGELETIIVVSAPDELRKQRVISRDGVTREEVELKMKSQIPQEEKVRRATHVILNDERSLLIPQVERLYSALTR